MLLGEQKRRGHGGKRACQKRAIFSPIHPNCRLKRTELTANRIIKGGLDLEEAKKALEEDAQRGYKFLEVLFSAMDGQISTMLIEQSCRVLSYAENFHVAEGEVERRVPQMTWQGSEKKSWCPPDGRKKIPSRA